MENRRGSKGFINMRSMIPYMARIAGRFHGHLHFSTNTEDVGIVKTMKKRVSFAKSLACLSEEDIAPVNRKPSIPIEHDSLERRASTTVAHARSVVSMFEGAMQEAWVKDAANEVGHHPMSLAKSLACLPDETLGDRRNPLTRMELKRAMELRIKKRVKEQCFHGKFYDILEKVISEPSTLKDSYDIVRLNSNICLEEKRDEMCFDTISDQLRRGDFDVKANTFSFSIGRSKNEFLVLPNLKLRVIQEAIRIALEVVYRPSFSRISHGCRSGRGPMSALKFVSQEMRKSDWWFPLHMEKKADHVILYNLISFMREKIEDMKLFSTIQLMFEAKVPCLEFGGYPKGQGLPQEGALTPILMNIYLSNLDSELFRIFMRYEGLSMDLKHMRDGQSKLRQWVRRHMKGNNGESEMDPDVRLCACRYMDEIIVAGSGPREVAVEARNEIHDYIKKSLDIDVIDRNDIQAISDASKHGIQFTGMVVSFNPHVTAPVRGVHKLRDKVKLFAAQKKETWNTGMVRVGKKCLAYSLKRIKESEIKQLGLSEPLLDQISHHRKEGMKTEHWFNVLIKIWLQDVSATVDTRVKEVLAKHMAEPAVPQELRESFYRFQKCAEEYISSETSSTLELLSDISRDKKPPSMITKIDAPVYHIQKKLMKYGLVNEDGFPRYVSALVLHDDSLIVHWFSGIIRRWLKLYSKHQNFKDIKSMMIEYIQKSCIRTLSAKHKMDESLVEKRFGLELNGIPLTEDLETDLAALAPDPCNADADEALMYGILHSGLCQLSLSRTVQLSGSPTCAIFGCSERSPCIYTINTRDQQKFPGWRTGFATGIHPSLRKEKFALCNRHVKDLYLGNISLQSVEFGCFRR